MSLRPGMDSRCWWPSGVRGSIVRRQAILHMVLAAKEGPDSSRKQLRVRGTGRFPRHTGYGTGPIRASLLSPLIYPPADH